MPDQDGDKSQEATPHRRQKAREEGQVAKSQDLGSAVLLVGALLILLMLGGALIDFLGNYTARQLGGQLALEADIDFVMLTWHSVIGSLARYVLPILAGIMAVSVLVNLMQVGFLFLPNKLAPDITRLDPLKGIGRMFSMTNFMKLLFGIFKILVIGSVAFVVLYGRRESIMAITAASLPEVAAFLIDILWDTALMIGIALLILAILDYTFQRWKHEQDLKMTSQEVREEMKNLQGDPQVIARRRVVQRQLAMNRLSDSVPKADVVVTNPTELSVAIQYDPKTMAAPIVLAKGAGLIAQRIRRLALEHGIPIVEKKPLAQALYREVEINHPVPSDKYAAVAELLAYVYQLKGKSIPDMPNAAA